MICGKKTGLIFQRCTDSLNIKFVTGSTAYKGMKVYYESKLKIKTKIGGSQAGILVFFYQDPNAVPLPKWAYFIPCKGKEINNVLIERK